MTQDYPAGLDRLWAAFGSEDYPRQKYLALGATAVRLDCVSATAQAIDVALERDLPVDPRRLPSWARWLIGRQQTLRHRWAWRPSTSRMVLTWRVASDLPLIGHKVERLFADLMRRSLDAVKQKPRSDHSDAPQRPAVNLPRLSPISRTPTTGRR